MRFLIENELIAGCLKSKCVAGLRQTMNTEPLWRQFLHPSPVLQQQKGVGKKYLWVSLGCWGLLAGAAAGHRLFPLLSGTWHLAAEIL